VRAVLDTNILVDYLNEVEQARDELRRYRSPAISIISFIEVLVGARSQTEERRIRGFLGRFEVRPLSAQVAELAIGVRRERRIRLPDAVVWATALELECVLVSRNERDFPSDEPGVRLPYRLALPLGRT
jgi:predicted nucleic acid-binding protein